jgi:hypothetical protein
VRKAFPLVLLTALLISCGPYSFSGSTLGGIKTVYIPVFDNETIEYGLGDELTNNITSAIVADNTLKVVGQNAADAIISGQVVSFKRSSQTYNIQDQVQEYRVDVAVNVKFSRADGEVIWEEPGISAYGLYSADTETEDEGKTEALSKLAEVIVNKIVRNW